MKLYIKSTSEYKYCGSVADRFGNILIRDWECKTRAGSIAQARNNILFQAKKRLGLKPTAFLKLTKPEDVEDLTPIDNSSPRCPECGWPLSDGGYCPRCYAYGDETHYL
jgi:hypothetical protein